MRRWLVKPVMFGMIGSFREVLSTVMGAQGPLQATLRGPASSALLSIDAADGSMVWHGMAWHGADSFGGGSLTGKGREGKRREGCDGN